MSKHLIRPNKDIYLKSSTTIYVILCTAVNMTLIDDYFALQEQYEKKFGEKTIVLMQVGGFFEIYGVVTDTIKKGRMYEICDITNLNTSKRHSKTDPVSPKNPLMAGFPNHSFDKWQDILLKHNYTIIKIEQDTNGESKPSRAVTEIISPGVNINSKNFSNNMLSLYLEEYTDSKTKQPILQIGVAIIDVTTGHTRVYETHSDPNDFLYSLDELFRIIQMTNPCEIIIHTHNTGLTNEKILKYLEIERYQVHFNMYSDSHLLKNQHKHQLLAKVFPDHGVLTPVEYIGLHRSNFALIAYIYIIQFTHEHNATVVQRLCKPVVMDESKYLILSHDSINQLNLVKNMNDPGATGIQSLWDVLDKTKTAIGRRVLKKNLLNPIVNEGELNERYALIENFREGDMHLDTRNLLKNIVDIERLHRKMAMNVMNPSSFISLDMSYIGVLNLVATLKNHNGIQSIIPTDPIIKKFEAFIADYNSKLIMDNLCGVNLNGITEPIFRPGLFVNIDVVVDKIRWCKKFLTQLTASICEYATARSSKKVKQFMSLKRNDRDGHYLHTTKARAKQLKQLFETDETATPSKAHFNFNVVDTPITIKFSDITFKTLNTASKVSHPLILKYSQALASYEVRLAKLSLIEFSDLLSTYYIEYKATLNAISRFVGYTDFISNLAYVSLSNGYFKPTIQKADRGYFKAKDLRHPIIEVVHSRVKYVPNDLELGCNGHDGMLLYGVNAVGKSSLMKAAGIAIIMAQMGSYVPAREFTYSPYRHIFTRISSNDNIFKGQSTFAVEMSELRSIMTRANTYSLILGDELCSGTETTSGISIVTAGVMRLADKHSSFIFATHLHALSDMPEIKERTNVHNYHMETIFDGANKTLIYDRKLKPGSGNAIYGLEVAKAMNLDAKFIQCAEKIRKRIMGQSESIVKDKVSVYNAKLAIESCGVCGVATEEVHHIEEQHLANDKGMIDYFHKNNLFNLVQLCHNCHHEVHHGSLIIKGYIDTSEGRKLDFEKVEKKQHENIRRKYSFEDVRLVKDTYDSLKRYTLVKRYIETKYNKNISVPTIKKMVLGGY